MTPWTVDWQAPLSMGFPRQEYWSGLPFPPPGYLPNLGIEPMSLASLAWQADSLLLSHLGSPFLHNPKQIVSLNSSPACLLSSAFRRRLHTESEQSEALVLGPRSYSPDQTL